MSAEKGHNRAPQAARDPHFESLLAYLRDSRGLDLTCYKRPSLMRRVQRRMAVVGVADYDEYAGRFEAQPEELAQLFDTVLINLTSFFRDPAVWHYLVHEVIPRIAQAGDRDRPVRVWSAGCASGEEAYSLAILFADCLGEDDFARRVKVYATDIDEEALAQARQAVYGLRQVAEQVPPDYRDRFFQRGEHGWAVRKELRRALIFGRHDLMKDPPISRVDLLACRNTLMYLGAETQNKILTGFHFALAPDGFLVLGRSEALMSRTHLFRPVDLKCRVFAKVAIHEGEGRLRTRALQLVTVDRPKSAARQMTIYDIAFDASPLAQVIVDLLGDVVAINEAARSLLGLSNDDVGRPLRDLRASYRPVDLRSRIDEVLTARHPVAVRDVPWVTRSGERYALDVQVAPLPNAGDAGNAVLGFSITFADVTHHKRLEDELKGSRHELETAYEEVQSTVEELETTNEELQSTNEELETTNEELHSSSEELETMNDELQSTNDELGAINNELRLRSEQLDHANAFLEAVLTSLRTGLVVVDPDLRVMVWNLQAENLWGLRQDEVQGEHLLNLDIGLPVQALRPGLRACLRGQSDVEQLTVDAVNRRGKAIRCRTTCTPLRSRTSSEITGVIVLMESDEWTQLEGVSEKRAH